MSGICFKRFWNGGSGLGYERQEVGPFIGGWWSWLMKQHVRDTVLAKFVTIISSSPSGSSYSVSSLELVNVGLSLQLSFSTTKGFKFCSWLTNLHFPPRHASRSPVYVFTHKPLRHLKLKVLSSRLSTLCPPQNNTLPHSISTNGLSIHFLLRPVSWDLSWLCFFLNWQIESFATPTHFLHKWFLSIFFSPFLWILQWSLYPYWASNENLWVLRSCAHILSSR